MRRTVLTLALLLTAGQFLPPGLAQQVKLAGKRKTLGQIKAVYPPIARKMNLTGTVKVVAIVAPDGTVTRTQVIGGSPVLVQAAADAIARSKWQVGPQETKELIEIKFEPETE